MPNLTRFARPATLGLIALAATAAACSDSTGPAPIPAASTTSPAAAGGDTTRQSGPPAGTPAPTPADTGTGQPPAPTPPPADTGATRPPAPAGTIGGWALRPYDRVDTAVVGWGAAIGATVTVFEVSGDSAAGVPETLRQVATATIGVDAAFRTAALPDGVYRVRGTVTVGGVAHAGEQTVRLVNRQQQPALLHLLLRP